MGRPFDLQPGFEGDADIRFDDAVDVDFAIAKDAGTGFVAVEGDPEIEKAADGQTAFSAGAGRGGEERRREGDADRRREGQPRSSPPDALATAATTLAATPSISSSVSVPDFG